MMKKKSVAKENKRRNVNIAVAWLRHTYRIDKAAGHMLKTNVYNDYREMCATNKLEPTTASVFGKIVHTAFPKIKTARLLKGNGGVSRYHYKNLCKKSEGTAPFLPAMADGALDLMMTDGSPSSIDKQQQHHHHHRKSGKLKSDASPRYDDAYNTPHHNQSQHNNKHHHHNKYNTAGAANEKGMDMSDESESASDSDSDSESDDQDEDDRGGTAGDVDESVRAQSHNFFLSSLKDIITERPGNNNTHNNNHNNNPRNSNNTHNNNHNNNNHYNTRNPSRSPSPSIYQSPAGRPPQGSPYGPTPLPGFSDVMAASATYDPRPYYYAPPPPQHSQPQQPQPQHQQQQHLPQHPQQSPYHPHHPASYQHTQPPLPKALSFLQQHHTPPPQQQQSAPTPLQQQGQQQGQYSLPGFLMNPVGPPSAYSSQGFLPSLPPPFVSGGGGYPPQPSQNMPPSTKHTPIAPAAQPSSSSSSYLSSSTTHGGSPPTSQSRGSRSRSSGDASAAITASLFYSGFWKKHQHYAQALRDTCGALSPESIKQAASIINNFWEDVGSMLSAHSSALHSNTPTSSEGVRELLLSEEFKQQSVNEDREMYTQLADGVIAASSAAIDDVITDEHADVIFQFAFMFPSWLWNATQKLLPPPLFAAKMNEVHQFSIILNRRAMFLREVMYKHRMGHHNIHNIKDETTTPTTTTTSNNTDNNNNNSNTSNNSRNTAQRQKHLLSTLIDVIQDDEDNAKGD